MATQATRADALRISQGGTDVPLLAYVNTIPGVQIVAVASICGPGQGNLSLDAANLLTWTPPGGTAGVGVDVSAGGDFLIEGGDVSEWLRVHVEEDYLTAGAECDVWLADVFIWDWDITAAQASAGNVATLTLSIDNDSANEVAGIRIWIDADCDFLEISLDNTNWSSATTEATGLSIASLAAAGSAPLYVRRTIPSSTTFAPNVLQLVHLSFQAEE